MHIGDSSVPHDEGTVRSIYGSTALILGLGDIGGEFAKRFKALGGHTIGVRRTDAQKPDFVDELYLMLRLKNLSTPLSVAENVSTTKYSEINFPIINNKQGGQLAALLV